MGEAKRKRERAVEVLPNGICLGRNKPSPEGRVLGAMLADWADAGEPIARLRVPDLPPRCQSCAFRRGTIPNGCDETVLDAVGSIVENIPFMCHVEFDSNGEPVELCVGWCFAREAPEAKKMAHFMGGRMPDMPARSEATKAYLDEERRKLRAKR